MNSKVKNFKCPFCERQYDSLDGMYNCAKNDEKIAKQLERKNEEERKRKQIEEQSSILSQKLDDVNGEIDKYNRIVDGTNSPKIEKIYKFNFVKDKSKNDGNNIKSARPIINENSPYDLLYEIFKSIK